MDNSGFAAALQDSAASLYHNNITPLLQRCASYMAQPNTETLMPSLATQRALQHSDNLKWQQDMFYRLLHLVCLTKEGLASQQQLISCKCQVLAFLESAHPDGEWPEFTRDKLLFLQDLLFASCISENEYHASKKPLILRLADQGAIIDAEDFIFDSSTSCDVKVMKSKSLVRTPSVRRVKSRCMAESDGSKMPSRKTETDACTKALSSSPLKQVVGAVCRVNKSPSSKPTEVKTERVSCTPPNVPHALDFLRPEHCPVRDPPSPYQACQRMTDLCISHDKQQEVTVCTLQPDPTPDDFKDGAVCNWFVSPSASPKCNDVVDAVENPLLGQASLSARKSPSGTPSRFRNILTGLMPKRTLQSEVVKSPRMLQSSTAHNTQGEEDKPSSVMKGSKWGLEILRFPKKLQFDPEDNSLSNNLRNPSSEILHGTSVGPPAEGCVVQSPINKKLKKKVHSKGAPTDFIIDKVLGENVKNELSRIRAEMNKAQPGQTFSNEQIDAIATKLPMDKAELKKFFPQTWCERYGDVVLDVVQKEFKDHVGEMQKSGKAKDKQQQHMLSSPSSHNDENLEMLSPLDQHQHQLPRRRPDFSKCFTTLDENTPANNSIPPGASPRKHSSVDSPKSPSRFKLAPQHRYSRRLDMSSAEDNVDRKLQEEASKCSHLRA